MAGDHAASKNMAWGWNMCQEKQMNSWAQAMRLDSAEPHTHVLGAAKQQWTIKEQAIQAHKVSGEQNAVRVAALWVTNKQ